jgi:ABC-2 type transport system permease protein
MLNKALIVARREYSFNVRRPGFLFAAFGMPIFLVFMIFVVSLVIANTEKDVERLGTIGYVDQSGILSEAVAAPESFAAYNNEAAARSALDAETIGAYFVVPEDYLITGDVTLYGMSGLPEALQDTISDFLVANLSAQIDSELPVERIITPVHATYYLLNSGRTLNEEIFILVFLPFIFAIVFMIATQISSGYLMGGVIDEKSNRIMEILITSITPTELLVGKIIGLGALGLTQLAVWLVMGGVTLALGQNRLLPLPPDFNLSLDLIPLDFVLIMLVYFVLDYALFASLMAGIGVMVGSEQESRQYAGIIGLITGLPYFFVISFLNDPNGPLPVALTLFPFTAPLATIFRLGFGPVPAWQIIASMVILLVTTILIVWGSARVFRWGALLYGTRVTPRLLLNLIRRSPHAGGVITSAVREQTLS